MQHSTTMPTIYRSKRVTGLFIAVSIILGIFILLFLFQTMWYPIAFTLLVFGFVFHTFATTYYIVDGNTLKINCGFLVNMKVDITSIRKISETWDAVSSPATSLERLDIAYNKFDNVMISPENKMEFINHLKSINPEIEVKLYKN